MADEPSETHTHQARNGKFYATYEEMRAANVRMNQERLAALGLDKTTTTMTKKKTAKKRKPSSVLENVQARRSERRQSGESKRPEFYSPPVPVVKKKKTQKLIKPMQASKKAISTFMDDWDVDLCNALRTKFAAVAQADTSWLSKFKTYWRPLISEQNFRSIVRQVMRLASGQGIDYQHWPPEVIFCGDGQCVDMSTDFHKLYQMACDYETMYGKDKGHGWLVKIPLKKLAIFQRHYLEKLLGHQQQQQQDAITNSMEKAAQNDRAASEVITPSTALPTVEHVVAPISTTVAPPVFPVGTRFEKDFGVNGVHIGQVDSYDGEYYRVTYTDGDSEDLHDFEFRALRILPPLRSPSGALANPAPQVPPSVPRDVEHTYPFLNAQMGGGQCDQAQAPFSNNLPTTIHAHDNPLSIMHMGGASKQAPSPHMPNPHSNMCYLWNQAVSLPPRSLAPSPHVIDEPNTHANPLSDTHKGVPSDTFVGVPTTTASRYASDTTLPPPKKPKTPDLYIVEDVLEVKRVSKANIMCLIKWEGYEETTWEPISNLNDQAKRTAHEMLDRLEGKPVHQNQLPRKASVHGMKKVAVTVHVNLDGTKMGSAIALLSTVSSLGTAAVAASVNGGMSVDAETSRQLEALRQQQPQRYAVGTKIAKTFPGHGTYVGHVKSFDGEFYKVFYPRDEDEEDLTPEELSALVIQDA